VSPTYSVFGFSLHANVPVPGLNPGAGRPKDTPDIELHLGVRPSIIMDPAPDESPVYTSAYTAPSGVPALRIWRICSGGFLHLVYFDGMQFWINEHGTELWAEWPSHASVEEASSYVLGPVLGLLLRIRGVTCLHASAVAVENSAIAFVGSEGAGKSTTAAAFARSGSAVISDDVVPLIERGGEFWASPAYPHIWLWPESVELLYGSAEAVPSLIPGWEKRRIVSGKGGLGFEENALPLRAIYILDDGPSEPGPCVQEVTPQEGFFSMIANSYATNMLDREMRANEFKTLSGLVSKVPLRRLFTSKRSLDPQALCDAVRRDFAMLRLRS
jgi:hypothetical protein